MNGHVVTPALALEFELLPAPAVASPRTVVLRTAAIAAASCLAGHSHRCGIGCCSTLCRRRLCDGWIDVVPQGRGAIHQGALRRLWSRHRDGTRREGQFVHVPRTAVTPPPRTLSAGAPALPNASSDLLLDDLPTAHPALAIGRRLVWQDCHGVSRLAAHAGDPVVTRHGARIRLVYLPARETHDPYAAYHAHLVRAEVLLDRVMAARAANVRPVAPTLDDTDEARATVRPPRDLFAVATLEYRRWYEDDGTARAQPLTQEALAALLVADGLSQRQARDRAIHRSHALAAADQEWLIARRKLPPAQRPLNRSEFRVLVDAVDGAWQAPAGASHAARANRQIALRVAAALAGMLDEYLAPPFHADALNEAFNECLVAHLRQTIEVSRQADPGRGVLLAGCKAWFAAKAARMRVEHQIGLALAPAAPSALAHQGDDTASRRVVPLAAAG